MLPDPEKIKKIVLVRNDRFGEFLLNIPAFRAIKETYPQAILYLVVNSYVYELACLIDFVDTVITYENIRHKLGDIFKMTQVFKKENFDVSIIFNPSRDLNIISFLAGIPVRVGYKRKWGFLLTHSVEDKKYLEEKHEVEYNLDLARLIGAKTQNTDIFLTARDSNVSNELITENTIALHPWTSDPVKQWPVDNFVELANKLTDSGLKVLLIGGKEELMKSRFYFGKLQNMVIDFTGKTTLKELVFLLKKCRLLISCDSGPVHLACAVGTPAVVLFRNDIPGKTARRWGPWGKGHSVIEKNNLSDITVAEVLNKVKEVLNK